MIVLPNREEATFTFHSRMGSIQAALLGGSGIKSFDVCESGCVCGQLYLEF